jgi:hypothetical protein
MNVYKRFDPQVMEREERIGINDGFTSDTKQFHFHKRDFDWLIRNFEYS